MRCEHFSYLLWLSLLPKICGNDNQLACILLLLDGFVVINDGAIMVGDTCLSGNVHSYWNTCHNIIMSLDTDLGI